MDSIGNLHTGKLHPCIEEIPAEILVMSESNLCKRDHIRALVLYLFLREGITQSDISTSDDFLKSVHIITELQCTLTILSASWVKNGSTELTLFLIHRKLENNSIMTIFAKSCINESITKFGILLVESISINMCIIYPSQ